VSTNRSRWFTTERTEFLDLLVISITCLLCLSAAKEIAAMENRPVGELISSLARRARLAAETKVKSRNGVPLLKARKGTPRVIDGR